LTLKLFKGLFRLFGLFCLSGRRPGQPKAPGFSTS
jgi:hypothetical protein